MAAQKTLDQPLTLFGAPVGLYTGKIRSYLRKQGIPYVERLPSDPVFRKEVLPAIGRFINPVIRMPDGQIVQDTADIIDFLENKGYARTSALPSTPIQRIAALVLDLFGGEGLIRPAMHYRWSYRSENESFLRHEFGLSFRPGKASPEQVDQQLSQFMNYLNAYLPKLGITTETRATVESSYEDFLSRLDAHLRQQPYLLGGVPTLADYGLMAPLYAHLGRDPYPANLMKLKAPSVYRWTERMNAADPDIPEFPRTTQALLPDDALPESLASILSFIASDYLPELEMTAVAIDSWLSDPSRAEVEGRAIERTLCEGSFELRGQTIKTIVQPYTHYKLQRVNDAFNELAAPDQVTVETWLTAAGLNRLRGMGISRRVERSAHLEIWGPWTP